MFYVRKEKVRKEKEACTRDFVRKKVRKEKKKHVVREKTNLCRPLSESIIGRIGPTATHPFFALCISVYF